MQVDPEYQVPQDHRVLLEWREDQAVPDSLEPLVLMDSQDQQGPREHLEPQVVLDHKVLQDQVVLLVLKGPLVYLVYRELKDHKEDQELRDHKDHRVL